MTSHECEPLMSCGLNIVANSSNSNPPYMTYEKVSKKRVSIIRMTNPRHILVPIHITCMPERVLRAKMSFSPNV